MLVTHQNMSLVKCFDLIFKISILTYISHPSMKITSTQQMSVCHIIPQYMYLKFLQWQQHCKVYNLTVGHCPDFIFVTPSCTWISLSIIRHFLRIGYHKHRHECVATLSFPQSDTLNAFCHANAIRELQCFCLHLLE